VRVAVLCAAVPALAADPASRAAPPASGPAPPAVPLRLTGNVLLPDAEVRAMAGPPPRSGADSAAWAKAAVARIVAGYRERQYPYARAWWQLPADGGIRIAIDEGRMRFAFAGVRGMAAILLLTELHIPNETFHLPTVQRALDEMKRRRKLLHVYYRVREPGELEITPLDDAVPRRVLLIYVVTRERTGWDVALGSSATWGLLLDVALDRRLFWRDDRLRLKLEFAFPYRRYTVDADPSWRWVRGGVEVDYRFPRLTLHLAPRLHESLYLSHYDRHDAGVPSYYVLRNTALAGPSLALAGLEVLVAGGADYVHALWMKLATDGTLAPGLPGDTNVIRGMVRLEGQLRSARPALRHDYRSFLKVRFDAATSDARSWFVEGEGRGRFYAFLHRHRLILGGLGRMMGGDVRLWDEAPLANSFQRVYFGGRYWVRQAAQLETAYRVNSWWDPLDFGVFHDFSVFRDRTRAGHPVAWANAFGPSVHLLLFDFLAVDVYAGFGFSPKGFGDTVSFDVATVF
jgi:hypothetical protein